MPIFTLAAFYASKRVESIFSKKKGLFAIFQRFCLDHRTFFCWFRGFLVHYRLLILFWGIPITPEPYFQVSLILWNSIRWHTVFTAFDGYKDHPKSRLTSILSSLSERYVQVNAYTSRVLVYQVSISSKNIILLMVPQFLNWGWTYCLFRISFIFWSCVYNYLIFLVYHQLYGSYFSKILWRGSFFR